MRRLIAGLLVLCCASPVLAGWKTPREVLDRRLVSAEFHIFYTFDGEHAFPADANPAERPAQATAHLDALAEQFRKADDFYRKKLGLRPPRAGQRYAALSSIDVHIMRLEGKTGSTGDELHNFRYRKFEPSPAALAIALTNRWQPTSLTPAHELFHAYQYGYTYFKNAWFLEGMARSSESFFRIAPGRQSLLPHSQAELDAVMGRSYHAESLWNRLIHLCGTDILRVLLESYARLDREAALARGFDPAAWPEDEQRSDANNRYLLRGLAESVASHCPVKDRKELNDFKALLHSQR